MCPKRWWRERRRKVVFPPSIVTTGGKSSRIISACQSRGVLRVEDELKANNNGEPDFKLHLETDFLVVVRLSENAITEDVNSNSSFIPSKDAGINYGINRDLPITDLHKSVYQTVCMKPTIKYTELADNIGVFNNPSYTGIERIWLYYPTRRKKIRRVDYIEKSLIRLFNLGVLFCCPRCR